MEEFEVLIIGSGAGGFGAGLYCGLYKLKTLILGNDFGLTALATVVEDYPGIDSITGLDLIHDMKKQVKKFGVPVRHDFVEKIEKKGKDFIAYTKDKKTYNAKKLIIATGETHRKLGLKEEDKFSGKGVSYCATCDAMFFKDKVVGVVGGGDAAAQAALILAEYASKVYMFVRRDVFRAQPVMVERLEKNKKISLLLKSELKELKGKNFLEKVVYEENGKRKEMEMQGVFVTIGVIPQNLLAKQLSLKTDEKGFIIVDQKQKTSIEGVFAIGDITATHEGFKQIITACAEGAVAARKCYEELRH